MTCLCGHPQAAHEEHTTPRGFSPGWCTGGGDQPDTCCTCSYYEPDQGH